MSARAGDGDAETLAAYTAVIRHALELPPYADAVAELAARLDPPDAHERPPARAPAVRRLRSTLAALRERATPEQSLESLEADVTFLRVFEPARWTREELGRVLNDIRAEQRPAPARPRAKKKVVRFRKPPEGR
ncbi:MAG TPA: hypothetical protein VFC53_13975 [Dehalococcoidia bacterium]|jgi:hypothetical protein|nr:hypothetical protein [Dehalococcoidia bacterium]